MLLEVKAEVLSEENRNTKATDCNKLEGRQDIEKIEFVTNPLGESEDSKLALITYQNYNFKVNDDFIIVVEDENLEEPTELQEFKQYIAQTITNLNVKTSYKDTSDQYINNLKALADKNYKEGTESDIVLLKSNLSSRYKQTISLANIEGYENFEEEDFIIVNKDVKWERHLDGDGTDIRTIDKNYNKSTGILELGIMRGCGGSWTLWNTYDLYAIKRKSQVMNINKISNDRKETLEEFKLKLVRAIEEYGVKSEEEIPIEEKTKEQISDDIKKLARKKFDDGVATYMVLIKENLISRYNQTVSVTNDIEEYNNLTINDFLIVDKNIDWIIALEGSDTSPMTKNYDQNTGTLEFGMQKVVAYRYTFYNTYNVYWLKKVAINLEEYV